MFYLPLLGNWCLNIYLDMKSINGFKWHSPEILENHRLSRNDKFPRRATGQLSDLLSIRFLAINVDSCAELLCQDRRLIKQTENCVNQGISIATSYLNIPSKSTTILNDISPSKTLTKWSNIKSELHRANCQVSTARLLGNHLKQGNHLCHGLV